MTNAAPAESTLAQQVSFGLLNARLVRNVCFFSVLSVSYAALAGETYHHVAFENRPTGQGWYATAEIVTDDDEVTTGKIEARLQLVGGSLFSEGCRSGRFTTTYTYKLPIAETDGLEQSILKEVGSALIKKVELVFPFEAHPRPGSSEQFIAHATNTVYLDGCRADSRHRFVVGCIVNWGRTAKVRCDD